MVLGKTSRGKDQSCPQVHLRNVNVFYLFLEDDTTSDRKGLGFSEKLIDVSGTIWEKLLCLLTRAGRQGILWLSLLGLPGYWL